MQPNTLRFDRSTYETKADGYREWRPPTLWAEQLKDASSYGGHKDISDDDCWYQERKRGEFPYSVHTSSHVIEDKVRESKHVEQDYLSIIAEGVKVLQMNHSSMLEWMNS